MLSFKRLIFKTLNRYWNYNNMVPKHHPLELFNRIEIPEI